MVTQRVGQGSGSNPAQPRGRSGEIHGTGAGWLVLSGLLLLEALVLAKMAKVQNDSSLLKTGSKTGSKTGRWPIRSSHMAESLDSERLGTTMSCPVLPNSS